eukprot:CAMPEP_0182446178 /NCGR_PEP_ID=MMETSP1172-20130603/4036_1 /TAXON_ID=708627 /ORGANISM="Timspurckia oligopyrenoides, Strain CCMP3278" /LENGTH=263 /DNA_ID=CAMNT_0024642067 /DNA_START=180 /DNA_END=971 /DNA_ORIENTATION=+
MNLAEQEEFVKAKQRCLANQNRLYEASKLNASLRKQIVNADSYDVSLESKRRELAELQKKRATATAQVNVLNTQISELKLESSGDMNRIKFVLEHFGQLEHEKREAVMKINEENERMSDYIGKQVDIITALVQQLKSVNEKPATSLNAVRKNENLFVDRYEDESSDEDEEEAKPAAKPQAHANAKSDPKLKAGGKKAGSVFPLVNAAPAKIGAQSVTVKVEPKPSSRLHPGAIDAPSATPMERQKSVPKIKQPKFYPAGKAKK